MPNLDETLASLDQLKGSIEQDSCITKKPFMELESNPETESVPELKYTIPQATCYPVTAGVNLDIDQEKFKEAEKVAPDGNFYDVMSDKSVDEVRATLDVKMFTLRGQAALTDAGHLKVSRAVVANEFPITASVSAEGTVALGNANNLVLRDDSVTIKATNVPFVNGVDVTGSQVSYIPKAVDKVYLAHRIKHGYYPLPVRRFSGDLDVIYQERPPAPKPQLTMVLHYKMCSFSGDYGAGQTLKTFSLLPGEKTEISVRHYLRSESTKKESQHVLDSFSKSSANDLQNTVDNERTFKETESDTNSGSSNWNIGGNIGLNIGAFNLGIEGGAGGTKSNSFTSATEDQQRVLNKSVSSHVAKADTLRQIDVNTESSTTSLEENEETIHRTIENYNKSRVLNFVFRQLLQEYISITALVDVSFSYTNGYPESVRRSGISGLEDMLTELLVDDVAVQEVANEIYTNLCNIKNHLGDRESMIELSEENLGNCINPGVGEIDENYVKVKNIDSIYDERFPVKGIITSVATRITRTSSLVCDALLGQGEALDCYNQKLQDAAAVNANLDNLELVQRIASVENIVDPEARAAAYKKIFGECCETPQTQVIS